MRPWLVLFALALLPLGTMADPINLTFTGTATGTLGGSTSFTDATFTLTSIGDSGTIFSDPSISTYFLPASTSTISIGGLPVATFTDATAWFDPQGSGDVGFEDQTLGAGLIGITALSEGLETYQFSTSLGPVSGFAFEPNIFANFQNIPTTQGLLTIDHVSTDVTFNAYVATPEPATAWLFFGGAIFMGLVLPRRLRRRFGLFAVR